MLWGGSCSISNSRCATSGAVLCYPPSWLVASRWLCGIGANTAIFTLVDQLLLRLLPVKDPQQLVMISSTGPHMGSNRGDRASSYPMYQDFQRQATAFSYVFCRFNTPLSVSFGGQTERVNGELVSGNYFEALGVKPALGRVFSPGQDDRTTQGSSRCRVELPSIGSLDSPPIPL